MSCHVMLCYVMLCYVMLCYVMLCYVMLCYIISCHIMSCHIMSCHIMSYHVISCHVMSCHVMSCHVMSCHVMSYHVMSYHLLLHEQIRVELTGGGKIHFIAISWKVLPCLSECFSSNINQICCRIAVARYLMPSRTWIETSHSAWLAIIRRSIPHRIGSSI